MSHLRSLKLIILSAMMLFTFITVAYAANTSPVGYWRTIDDKTQQPASDMQIWEQDGKLYGRIVKIFPVNGNKSTDLCVKCPEPYYNKPILGMTVMWNFTKDDDMWTGGQIMDPKIGKIYRCQLKLINNGTKLHVHGYIGFPWLGRTQTWERLENYKPAKN